MSDPDLTPSEEQVRRLLADARQDESMPDDVVVRLDRVLADLQAGSRRTPDPVDAVPVDLAARRRRRVARNLLIAAAAVVVLGVGISRVDLSGQAESSADSGADSGAVSAPESAARDDEAGGDAGGSLNRLVKGPPVALSSEGFDRQALLISLQPVPASGASMPQQGYSGTPDQYDSDTGALAKRRGWCNDPAWGVGERIPVRYDGQRGVLVLRPASDDTRAADLYLCGETVATRSTTVPAG